MVVMLASRVAHPSEPVNGTNTAPLLAGGALEGAVRRISRPAKDIMARRHGVDWKSRRIKSRPTMNIRLSRPTCEAASLSPRERAWETCRGRPEMRPSPSELG